MGQRGASLTRTGGKARDPVVRRRQWPPPPNPLSSRHRPPSPAPTASRSGMVAPPSRPSLQPPPRWRSRRARRRRSSCGAEASRRASPTSWSASGSPSPTTGSSKSMTSSVARLTPLCSRTSSTLCGMAFFLVVCGRGVYGIFHDQFAYLFSLPMSEIQFLRFPKLEYELCLLLSQL
jgi:hypothetical protein